MFGTLIILFLSLLGFYGLYGNYGWNIFNENYGS